MPSIRQMGGGWQDSLVFQIHELGDLLEGKSQIVLS